MTNGSKVDTSTLPWEMINVFANISAPPTDPIFSSTPTFIRKEPDLKNAASQAEYETIMNVLKQVNFNKTRAAEILKIDRKTLYNKLRSYESQTQVEE